MGTLTALAASLADLVLPGSCVGCAEPGPALCGRCAGPLEPIEVELDALTVLASGPYEDGLRSGVLAYKERGRRDVGRVLAGRLDVSVQAVLADLDVDLGSVALCPT